MGFRPGAWKDGGRRGSCSRGRVGSPGEAASRAECRKCHGHVDSCPQTCFPPHGPHLDNHSPSQSEKRQAQPGRRSICSHSWAPFPADQLTCAVKMLIFPNPKQSKIKSKPPNQPSSAWKFLWLKCPKVRGTLPAQSLL